MLWFARLLRRGHGLRRSSGPGAVQAGGVSRVGNAKACTRKHTVAITDFMVSEFAEDIEPPMGYETLSFTTSFIPISIADSVPNHLAGICPLNYRLRSHPGVGSTESTNVADRTTGPGNPQIEATNILRGFG
jgi:hypothetical protein